MKEEKDLKGQFFEEPEIISYDREELEMETVYTGGFSGPLT